MMRRATGDEIFRARLNELFDHSERRITNRTVARGIAAQGYRISIPYLSQLRNGVRGKPSGGVVDALAQYFGVTSVFFACCGDESASYPGDEKVIAGLHDSSLGRLLSLASGLSAGAFDLLVDATAQCQNEEAGM